MDIYENKTKIQKKELNKYISASKQNDDFLQYADMLNNESENFRFKDAKKITAINQIGNMFRDTGLHYLSPGTSDASDPFSESGYEVVDTTASEHLKELESKERKLQNKIFEKDIEFTGKQKALNELDSQIKSNQFTGEVLNQKQKLSGILMNECEKINAEKVLLATELSALTNEITTYKESPEYRTYIETKEKVRKEIDNHQLSRSKKVVEYFRKGKKLQELESKYKRLDKEVAWYDLFSEKRGEKKRTKKEMEAIRKNKRQRLLRFQAGSLSTVKGFLSSVDKDKSFDNYAECFEKQVKKTYAYSSNKDEIEAKQNSVKKVNLNDDSLLTADTQQTNIFRNLCDVKDKKSNKTKTDAKNKIKEEVENLSAILTSFLLNKVKIDEKVSMTMNSQLTQIDDVKSFYDGNIESQYSLYTRYFKTYTHEDFKALMRKPEYYRMFMVTVISEIIQKKLDFTDDLEVNDVLFGDLDGISRVARMTLSTYPGDISQVINEGIERNEKLNAQMSVDKVITTGNDKLIGLVTSNTKVANLLNKKKTIDINGDKNLSTKTVESTGVIVAERLGAIKKVLQKLNFTEKQQNELADLFMQTHLSGEGIDENSTIYKSSSEFWNKINLIEQKSVVRKKNDENRDDAMLVSEFTKYFNSLIFSELKNVMSHTDSKSPETLFLKKYTEYRSEHKNITNYMKDYFLEKGINLGNFSNVIASKSFKYVCDAFANGDQNVIENYLELMFKQYVDNVAALEGLVKKNPALAGSNQQFIQTAGDMLCIMSTQDTLNKAKLAYLGGKQNDFMNQYQTVVANQLMENKIQLRYYPYIYEMLQKTLDETYFTGGDFVDQVVNWTIGDVNTTITNAIKFFAGNIETNMKYFETKYASTPLRNSDWVMVKGHLDKMAIWKPENFIAELNNEKGELAQILAKKVSADEEITEFQFTEGALAKWNSLEKEYNDKTKNNASNGENRKTIQFALEKILGELDLNDNDNYPAYYDAFFKAFDDALKDSNKKEKLPAVVSNLTSVDELYELNAMDLNYLCDWIRNAILNRVGKSDQDVIAYLKNESNRYTAFSEILLNGAQSKDLAEIIQKRIEYNEKQDQRRKAINEVKFSITVNKTVDNKPLDVDYMALNKDTKKVQGVLSRIEKFNKVNEFRGKLRNRMSKCESSKGKSMEMIFDEMVMLFSEIFESGYRKINDNNYDDIINNKSSLTAATYEKMYQTRLTNFFKYLNGDKPTNEVNRRIKTRLEADEGLKMRFEELQQMLKEDQSNYKFCVNNANELSIQGFESSFMGKGGVEEKLLYEQKDSMYNRGLHRISKGLSDDGSMVRVLGDKLSEQQSKQYKQVETVLKSKTDQGYFERQFAVKKHIIGIYLEGEKLKNEYDGVFSEIFSKFREIDLKQYFNFLEPLRRTVFDKIRNAYTKEDIQKELPEIEKYAQNYMKNNEEEFEKVFIKVSKDDTALKNDKEKLNALKEESSKSEAEVTAEQEICKNIDELEKMNKELKAAKKELRELKKKDKDLSKQYADAFKDAGQADLGDLWEGLIDEKKDAPVIDYKEIDKERKKNRKLMDEKSKAIETLENSIADLSDNLTSNFILPSNYESHKVALENKTAILKNQKAQIDKLEKRISKQEQPLEERKKVFYEYKNKINNLILDLGDNLKNEFNEETKSDKQKYYSEDVFEKEYGVRNYFDFSKKITSYLTDEKDKKTKDNISLKYNRLTATKEHALLNPYMCVLEDMASYWDIVTISDTPANDLQNLYDKNFKVFDDFFKTLERKSKSEEAIGECEKQIFIQQVKGKILEGGHYDDVNDVATDYRNFVDNFYNRELEGQPSINKNIQSILADNGNSYEIAKAFSDLSIMVNRNLELMNVYYDKARLSVAVNKYKERRAENWKLISTNKKYLALRDRVVPRAKQITYKDQLNSYLDSHVMEFEPSVFAQKIDSLVDYVEQNVTFNYVSKKDKEAISDKDYELSLVEININKQQYFVDYQLKDERAYMARARRLRLNKYSPVAYSHLDDKTKASGDISNLNSFKWFLITDMDGTTIDNDKKSQQFLRENYEWEEFFKSMVYELNIGSIQTQGTVEKNADLVRGYINKLAGGGATKKKPEFSEENQRKVMFCICHNIPVDEMKYGIELYESLNDQIGMLKKLSGDIKAATDVTAELDDDVKSFQYMMYAEKDINKLNEMLKKRTNYYRCLMYINTAATVELQKYQDIPTDKHQIIKKELEKMLALNVLKNDAIFEQNLIDAKVQLILANKSYRDVLVYRSGYRQYGSVSSEEISKNSGANGDISEEKFTEIIKTNVGEAEGKMFSKMTSSQKNAFALALQLPANVRTNDKLYSNGLIFGSKQEELDENNKLLESIARNIMGFVEGETFVFKPAIDRLLNNQGYFNKQIFQRAFELINAFENMLGKYKDRNWEALNNPNESAEIFRASNENAYTGTVDIKNLTEFQSKIIELTKNTELTARIQGYNDEQLSKLVTALMNRSIFDKPADTNSDSSVVNEVMRKETWKMMLFKEHYQERSQKSQNANYINRAFTTLLSCQVNENVKKGKLHITKDDLVKESLERTTALDETLLESAMNFVEESDKCQQLADNKQVIARYDKLFSAEERKRSNVPSDYAYAVNYTLFTGDLYSKIRDYKFDIFGKTSNFHKEDETQLYYKSFENFNKKYQDKLSKIREETIEKSKLNNNDDEMINILKQKQSNSNQVI